MKKLLSIFMSVILSLSFAFAFTACKKQPESTKESVEESPESVESESESVESFVPIESAETSVRVITVNVAAPTRFEDSYIKYNGQTPDDYKMNKRFVRLCALVDYFSPDVLMLQEVNGRGGWWDYLITNEDSFIKR